ncbi:MAG: hypothetical protein ACREP1_05955 [Rhodanobacteraceae bacterium]
MNDFSELETELKKLRPAPVSDGLTRRIERALVAPEETPTAGILPRPQRRTNGWWSFALGLTGVAALLVIGLTFFDQTPAPKRVIASVTATPSAAAGCQPAGLTQVVYSGRDEGLVYPADDSGAPRRRLRYETRQTVRWQNAKTGASVRVSYPVEQVVLTPVSFQ